MRIAFRPLTAALLVVGFASSVAQAQTTTPSFKLSGFGTLGMAHSSSDQADYVTSITQPNGAGFTRDWSGNPDSKLGVQADVNFTSQFSGVLQLVSKNQYDNSYTPNVEWANLKYQATPELAVRVGRIALPFFMHSDTRLVNYTQPWVRPPIEAYMVNPNTSNDGVDVMYQAKWGGVTHNLQAFYGVNNVKIPGGGNAKGNPNWGINDSAQIGDLTVRASYAYSKVDIPGFQPLTDLAAMGGLNYPATKLDFNTLALGATYDPGKWFVMGEFIDFRGESFAQGVQAWYVSGGYRFGSVTPYVTYASSRNHTKNETAPGFATAIVNSIVNNENAQDTLSLGVRWDFYRNMSLKGQYDRIDLGTNSTGRFGNVQPGFAGTGSDVFTVSVDFVF
jgi:hypothetical protein